ncbi:MAG: radical SAM/SPASM domain-containing protein [Proteobacteria bacterium]|nr:radical SAM/SPASM domain-containing protein [Pseudomonadota bacterium]
MESIYYVICWQCHRACRHCYEDKFRPYRGAELDGVVAEAVAAFPKIVVNFPERMTYLDLNDPGPEGEPTEKLGWVILAGGEVLDEPVREAVLYPVIESLKRTYRDKGGVKLAIQTTGDLVTDKIVGELLERGLDRISVSGIDDYHVGLKGEEAKQSLIGRLTSLFEARGMTRQTTWLRHDHDRKAKIEDRSTYDFWGATPETVVGKLWPRGRAWQNAISTATLADNFCNQRSGGLNFLQRRYHGSEVSVEPNGNVYPCCVKTTLPIGSLIEEKLDAMLDRLAGDPVYEAISMGHPERMGIAAGWSVEAFLDKCKVTLPSGRVYRNLCIGCDQFHREVLAPRRAQAQAQGRKAAE